MKKILILDDDRELCEELTEILKEKGLAAEFRLSGEEGKKEIEKDGYDIVMLDLKLPGKSGFELLKELDQISGDVKPRIYIMTGRPVIEQTHEQDKILKYADGIIEKPFDPQDLFDKLGV